MGSRSLHLARHLLDREPGRHVRRADLVGRLGISVRDIPRSSSHGFSFERKFSIHKVPLETYMSKLCVYFLIAPSAGLLIQPAIM